MTKSVKAVNYTAKNVEYMVAAYEATFSDSARKAVVEMLANELGKSTKSIIAKLSREGVYIKAVKATKSGAAIVSKAQLVASIAVQLEIQPSLIPSLTKATKADLETVLNALTNS